MKKLGFIGLGNMGRGMCDNLIKKGHALAVFDLNKEAMAYFEGKAALKDSPLAVFEASEVTFLSLPNSNVVEAIVGQFLQSGVAGKTIIDTSTSYPLSTKALHKQVKDAGGVYIDAPLLAGPAEAAAGTLTAMAGGDEADVETARPLFMDYCQSLEYVGPSGSAHMVKIFENFIGLSYALLLGQMFPLAEKLGLDVPTLQKTMDNEFFGNWVYSFYSDKFVNRNYRLDFALELAYKDLSYMKKMYDEFNVPAFALDGALDLLRVSLKEGKGKQDYSQLGATMNGFLGLPE